MKVVMFRKRKLINASQSVSKRPKNEEFSAGTRNSGIITDFFKEIKPSKFGSQVSREHSGFTEGRLKYEGISNRTGTLGFGSGYGIFSNYSMQPRHTQNHTDSKFHKSLMLNSYSPTKVSDESYFNVNTFNSRSSQTFENSKNHSRKKREQPSTNQVQPTSSQGTHLGIYCALSSKYQSSDKFTQESTISLYCKKELPASVSNYYHIDMNRSFGNLELHSGSQSIAQEDKEKDSSYQKNNSTLDLSRMLEKNFCSERSQNACQVIEQVNCPSMKNKGCREYFLQLKSKTNSLYESITQENKENELNYMENNETSALSKMLGEILGPESSQNAYQELKKASCPLLQNKECRDYYLELDSRSFSQSIAQEDEVKESSYLGNNKTLTLSRILKGNLCSELSQNACQSLEQVNCPLIENEECRDYFLELNSPTNLLSKSIAQEDKKNELNYLENNETSALSRRLGKIGGPESSYQELKKASAPLLENEECRDYYSELDSRSSSQSIAQEDEKESSYLENNWTSQNTCQVIDQVNCPLIENEGCRDYFSELNSQTNSLSKSIAQEYKENESNYLENNETSALSRILGGFLGPESSQKAYQVLEEVSCPLLENEECRDYFLELNSQTNFLSNQMIVNEHNYCSTKSSVESIDSHIQNFDSQSVLFFNNPDMNQARNLPHMKESSQSRVSNVINEILSRDNLGSENIMKDVCKYIKISRARIECKKNFNEKKYEKAKCLLEMGFSLYTNIKDKTILSNSRKTYSFKSPRNTVEVRTIGNKKIFALKQSRKKNLTIVNVSNVSQDEEDVLNNPLTLNSDNCDDQAQERLRAGLEEICRDKEFFYNEDYEGVVNDRSEIIKAIDNVFEAVFRNMCNNISPRIEVKRQTYDDRVFSAGRLVLPTKAQPQFICIKYENMSSQPKFCLIIYLLAKILRLFENDSKLPKREIYYQIKHLIRNQHEVDLAMNVISRILGVGPWDMNLIGCKGLVFGDLRITMSSQEVINCNVPGCSIPQDIDEIIELGSTARFILIVEKESIFFKLLEEDFLNRLGESFILITGKGFPDLNTQLFVRKLWMVMTLPVFILVDADPHGVKIMINYKFGSLANAHISHQLAIPKAKWLGVFPSDISKLNAEKQRLSQNEKKIVESMLNTQYILENSRMKQELEIFLKHGYKAGIEGLMKNDTFLSEFYFPFKFVERDLI